MTDDKNREHSKVNWTELESLDDLTLIDHQGDKKPAVIFKHSTRCGISTFALKRLTTHWKEVGDLVRPFYLDILKNRHVSNEVANRYDIVHESPQIIIISGGRAIGHTSHGDVNTAFIKAVIE